VKAAHFLLSCAVVAWAENPGLPQFQHDIPRLRRSRQLVLVITASWDATSAGLRCFERTKTGSAWQPALVPQRAVVGRQGLAWGLGLHGGPPGDGPVKREGDGRAPAGVFEFDEVFGYATPAAARPLRLPYRQLTDDLAGVDDPRSRHYNRIVSKTQRDWQSAEVMRRSDDLYRWGVVVRHNWQSLPGYGSCIFLHRWEGPARGTAGCTALAAEPLEALLRWLDRTRQPLLVQLPAAEYAAHKAAWHLP
jgi:D-alanyl-D-alanine dipeptidase